MLNYIMLFDLSSYLIKKYNNNSLLFRKLLLTICANKDKRLMLSDIEKRKANLSPDVTKSQSKMG